MDISADRTGGDALLYVLCGETELQEDGVVVRVGDTIRRIAGRRREGAWFGGDLDEVDWRFDQYAEAGGDEAALISGLVVAIDAVFVELHQHPDGWRPRVGSAHLEPVASTADTRVIREEIVWTAASQPDTAGGVWRTGHPLRREGDECLSGWLIILEEAAIEPLPGEAAAPRPRG